MFSANLRRHCAPRGMQTKLSAETGISVVQISRYLSGTIPSDRNLELIANFFGVEEHDLFRLERSSRYSDPGSRISERSSINNEYHILSAGYYFILFPNPGRSDIAVRSPVIIREKDRNLEFRRYTGLSYISHRTTKELWSIHEGRVLTVSESIYFSGYNKLPNFEPSLLCLKRLPTEAFAMVGHALVIVNRSPTSVPCALVRADYTKSAREHIFKDTSVHLSEYELGGLFQKIFEVPGRIEGVFAI